MTTRIRTAALALALCVPLCAAQASEYANPHLITTVDELKTALMEPPADDAATSLVVVDVREPGAFREGHLPGAVNVPYSNLTDPRGHFAGVLKSDGAIASLLARAGIDATSEVVLYDDQGGFRAARLFWLMEYFGHREVSILNGGIDEWVARGEASARKDNDFGKAMARAGKHFGKRFAITRAPRRFASADYIMDKRADAETVMVDVRPESAFADGHIPVGAKQSVEGKPCRRRDDAAGRRFKGPF